MRNFSLSLLLLVTLAASLPAASVTYSNRDLWAASLAPSTALTRIDFSNLAGVGDLLDVSAGLRTGNVDFTPTGDTQLLIADRDAPGYDFGVPAVLSPQLGFPAGFSASFLVPVTSFGVNLTGFLGDPSVFTARVQTALGVSIFQFGNGGFPPAGFFGVISNDVIQSVTFTSAPVDGVFFDFTHNGVAGDQIPEPATYALVGASLLLVQLLRAMRSRRRA